MTDKQPLVSIVIPCYNHAQFVQETIKSIIDQDYENIELIIIDDGSKDNSVDVIKEMIHACEERFIRFEFRYRPNKGACATLNEALKWCEGKFLSCIASDDIMLPDKTSYQVRYLESNKKTIGVFGGVDVLDNATGKIKTSLKTAQRNNFNDIFTYKHHLPTPTQMLRLAAVKNVGGYREDLIIEDWSMWLFLTENGGTLDYVDKVFSKYRRHSGNLSGRFDLMSKGRQEVISMFYKKPGYRKARAMARMVDAHDVQTLSKLHACKISFNAFVIYPFVFFSKSFFWLFIKMIIIR